MTREASLRRSAVALPLFRAGFRPFFLGAGLYAAVPVIAWVHAWNGERGLPATIDLLWHGHEALFGFAVAALAGFLLTAVPNWTGGAALRGAPLVALFGAWLAGRAAMFAPVPPTAAALVDLAFLPALAATIGPGIVARGGRRNAVFVAVLAILWTADFAWHADRLGRVPGAATPAIQVALALFMLLIAVVGGRVVPAFTIGGMRLAGRPVAIAPAPRLDVAAIAALILAFACKLGGTPDGWTVSAFAVAAILHAVRLARWRGWLTLRVPLVAILHLGYAWLVLGLALEAAANAGLATASVAAHAFGAGAAGTMILAVMTRASLGHTGRALAAGRSTLLAYALVTIGAALRVAAALAGETHLIEPAALAWSAGFLVFALGYARMLATARPDGRPG